METFNSTYDLAFDGKKFYFWWLAEDMSPKKNL